MKKLFIIITLITTLVTLTACGANNLTDNTQSVFANMDMSEFLNKRDEIEKEQANIEANREIALQIIAKNFAMLNKESEEESYDRIDEFLNSDMTGMSFDEYADLVTDMFPNHNFDLFETEPDSTANAEEPEEDVNE